MTSVPKKALAGGQSPRDQKTKRFNEDYRHLNTCLSMGMC
jgi:hypothetical protein